MRAVSTTDARPAGLGLPVAPRACDSIAVFGAQVGMAEPLIEQPEAGFDLIVVGTGLCEALVAGCAASPPPRLRTLTSAHAELQPGRARACCTWTTRATTGRRRARRRISSPSCLPVLSSQWASFGVSELHAWLAAGDAAVSAAAQAPLAATPSCCPVDAAAAARRRLSSVSFAGVDAAPDTPLAALRGCSFDLAGPKARALLCRCLLLLTQPHSSPSVPARWWMCCCALARTPTWSSRLWNAWRCWAGPGRLAPMSSVPSLPAARRCSPLRCSLRQTSAR